MLRSTLRILNILHIFNDGFGASILLFLPFIAKEFSANFTHIGLLGTSMNSLQVVLALPAGYLAKRIGGLRLLIFAVLLYAVGYIGIALGPTFWSLVPLFFVAGIGFALFHPVAFALVAKESPKNILGRAMGAFTAIGDVGRIGLVALITFLVVRFGWRTTAFMYGGVGFLLFIGFFTYMKRKVVVSNSTNKIGAHTPLITLWHILTGGKFFFTNLAGTLDSFASSSLFIFLPFLLLSKGIEPSVLGSFTAAFFVGNIGGKYFLGRFVDRYSNATIFIVAELCMALFIVLLTNATSAYIIVGFSIILGALTKGTVPVIQTMLSESVEHHRNYEKSYGLSALIISISTVIAPIVLGIISDRYGIVAAFYVSALFAVFATVPAAGFAWMKRSK